MASADSLAQDRPAATRQMQRGAHAIPVVALGWSLSLSFVISFTLCVLGYILLPSLPVLHGALAIALPGFQLDSWPRFFLGLAESFAWGWYIAVVFGSLYNYFAARFP
jgi:hypothetical protein